MSVVHGLSAAAAADSSVLISSKHTLHKLFVKYLVNLAQRRYFLVFYMLTYFGINMLSSSCIEADEAILVRDDAFLA